MINLLPYEDKKEVEREGLRRFLIVAILSISTLVFLSILLMGPIYLIIFQDKSGAQDTEELLHVGAPLDQIKQVTAEIKKINLRLNVINANSSAESIPELIKKILGFMPDGIKLDGIEFERLASGAKGRISVKGNANTRENLLNFLKLLNESDLFTKVDSPVSNILKKTDVDFSVTLDIK